MANPAAEVTELGRGWRWSVPLVCLVLTALELLTGSNRAVFRALNGWPAVTGEGLWLHLTVLGGGAVLACSLLPCVGRRPDVVWAGLLLALACYGAVELCKTALPLQRPASLLPPGEVQLIGPELRKNSFPSGHTTTAFALAGLLASTVVRGGWRAVPLLLATLVGLSRVVIGAHWPVDVLAGAVLGWALALLAVAAARRWTFGLRPGVQRVLAVLLVVSAVRLVHDPGRYAEAAAFQRGIGVVALLAAVPGCWRLFAPAAAGYGASRHARPAR